MQPVSEGSHKKQKTVFILLLANLILSVFKSFKT